MTSSDVNIPRLDVYTNVGFAPDDPLLVVFFFSSRRRHTRSVSAFLLNRSSDLVVFNRPINILCRVSLFLSMALCLLLRLFVFRLLRLKRFSTLTLKVL